MHRTALVHSLPVVYPRRPVSDPAHLRAQADQLDAEALDALDASNATGDKLEELRYFQLATSLRIAAKALRDAARLTGGSDGRIIRGMSQPAGTMSADVKRGKGRSTRKHPAQLKFYEHNVTIKDVAKELGETRARVSSWMADGDALRAIPRNQAEKLRDKYGVPLSAWKRIAD